MMEPSEPSSVVDAAVVEAGIVAFDAAAAYLSLALLRQPLDPESPS